MPGVDNKIFLKHSEVLYRGATLNRAYKQNKRQKLIQQNGVFLENASFCNCCRLIAATIRPAAA